MLCLRARSLTLPLAAALFVALWPTGSRADLILAFDATSYAIGSVGATTTVKAYVEQVPGTLPAVDAFNPLFTAGITLSFAAGGAAVETGFASSTGWDDTSSSTSTSGLDTVIRVTSLSLGGITDFSNPVLLGTFTFTGTAIGSTTMTLASLTPGVSFIDLGGDDLDPTRPATATIRVGSAAVPEPGSLALMGVASAALAARLVRRRRISTAA